MVLPIVKIRPMAVTSPAMIMTAATAKAVAVAVKTVMTVPMIGRLTDLNAVILPGMNMELTVQHWKVHTAGIAPVVVALVILVVLMVVLMVVAVMLVI